MATRHPRITVSIPRTLLSQLDAVARMFGKSRSAAVVTMLESALPLLARLETVARGTDPQAVRSALVQVLVSASREVSEDVARLADPAVGSSRGVGRRSRGGRRPDATRPPY